MKNKTAQAAPSRPHWLPRLGLFAEARFVINLQETPESPQTIEFYTGSNLEGTVELPRVTDLFHFFALVQTVFDRPLSQEQDRLNLGPLPKGFTLEILHQTATGISESGDNRFLKSRSLFLKFQELFDIFGVKPPPVRFQLQPAPLGSEYPYMLRLDPSYGEGEQSIRSLRELKDIFRQNHNPKANLFGCEVDAVELEPDLDLFR